MHEPDRKTNFLTSLRMHTVTSAPQRPSYVPFGFTRNYVSGVSQIVANSHIEYMSSLDEYFKIKSLHFSLALRIYNCYINLASKTYKILKEEKEKRHEILGTKFYILRHRHG